SLSKAEGRTAGSVRDLSCSGDTQRDFRPRKIFSAQYLQQTTATGRLRRDPFRIPEPAWPDRSVENILGAGDILAKIPQIFPSDHASPAFFLFHFQGCGSRSHRQMAPDEPV